MAKKLIKINLGIHAREPIYSNSAVIAGWLQTFICIKKNISHFCICSGLSAFFRYNEKYHLMCKKFEI